MTLRPVLNAARARAGTGAAAGLRALRGCPARVLARIVLAVILAVALLVGPRPTRLGDRYQVALPLLGLVCAVASGGAGEYALRYGVAWTGVRLGKNTLGDRPIAHRPAGGDGGMPSGHTTSASFGASALVNGCLSHSPLAQSAAIVAAGFTGASRIDAGAHTIWQVLAGVLWALLCERALRRTSAARTAAVRGLRAIWRRIAGGAARTARRLRQGAMRQQPVSMREPAPEPSNTKAADRP